MSQTTQPCPCCDAWLDLPGFHVIAVDHDDHAVVVTVASDHAERGCPSCGVLARVHDRRTVTLIDAPAMGRPVRLHWVKHRYVYREHLCDQHTFTETDERIARAGHLLTTRATRWAIEQLRREHASVSGLARQLALSWKTLWRAIKPVLQTADADPTRLGLLRVWLTRVFRRRQPPGLIEPFRTRWVRACRDGPAGGGGGRSARSRSRSRAGAARSLSSGAG